MTKRINKHFNAMTVLIATVFLAVTLPQARAQYPDQSRDEDPPGRAARLGHIEGSVSFQPAGESEWVEAVPNRPMTTGDKLWADRDSRAEVQLGSASIHVNSNTGFSFLNLDDRTVQLQLSTGTISVRVRRLNRNDVFEIDTPNQAFSVFREGNYRLEASEDGSTTVVTVREGEGESTGNGQTYTVRAGQRATFSGTNQLNAEVEDIRGNDNFDNWSYGRDRRYDDSPSGRYCSRDMVGYEDLDEYGDWRPQSEYGNVWFPRVSSGWAPYHEGHWAWIDPWGWTWVDEEPWGYAPFHYGRWAAFDGRWGWVPGPVAVVPVYAPALVVFIGGGGVAFGDTVAWFPLGPREVYVPAYRASPAYVNRVNISNTTVNQTTITNVYNTTIVNNNTNITNVNYVNRNAPGAVVAVPQRAFVSAQPVSRSAVAVNPRQFASAPVSARPAVAPTPNSVLGARANTANHVPAPPAAVTSRPVIAKATPPPPPPAFAVRQPALAAHPGQPLARPELQKLRRSNGGETQPLVRQAPPGRPATMNRPGSQPANQPANAPGNQPAPRSGNPPVTNDRAGAGRPGANPPQPQPGNRPEPNRPQPNQPAPTRPSEPPARNDRPPSAQPGNRSEPNRPQPNQPAPGNQPTPTRPPEPPARNDRPPSAQPGNRPEPSRPQPNQPAPNNRAEPNRPAPNARPEPGYPPPNVPQPARPSEPPPRNDRPTAAPPQNNRPEQNRPEPRYEPSRPQNPPPNTEPQHTAPAAQARPAPPPPSQPQTPEERRRQDEQRKRNEKPQPPQ
jgi:hypothetical protein